MSLSRTRSGGGRYSLLPLNVGVRTRTLRGAVCGVVAAAAWTLEQPLDKLLLDSEYDDIELLGKAFTKGSGWYPIGLALHLANGAAFGAIYANVASYLPLAPFLRGPAAALTEHVALWPLGSVSDRLHPARKELPPLQGNGRAFVQATVRHLLFGITLGELERRFNARPDQAPPPSVINVSHNGHGSIERAISEERTS